MLQALRYLRAAISEFYFDLPRMVLLNLSWFVVCLPFIWVVFVLVTSLAGSAPLPWPVLAVQGIILGALTLALAGPATAAIYHVTNRLANGELLEPRRFWPALRRYFWRGWLLALADAGAGGLLVLNIWFYWNLDRPGVWLLSIVFAYLLVLWFAIQGYLFALLVELNQPILLVVRNALFLAIDNLGLTLGLTLVNLLLLIFSLPFGAMFLPMATMAITSNVNNKAVVDAIRRYRESGRIIAGDRPRPSRSR